MKERLPRPNRTVAIAAAGIGLGVVAHELYVRKLRPVRERKHFEQLVRSRVIFQQ